MALKAKSTHVTEGKKRSDLFDGSVQLHEGRHKSYASLLTAEQ